MSEFPSLNLGIDASLPLIQQALTGGGQFASMLGPMGALGGTFLNFFSQMIGQNHAAGLQEDFYNAHQSPSARMREMQQAGINPAAAAQGISGSQAAGFTAPGAGSGAAPGLSDTLAKVPLTAAESRLADANSLAAQTQAAVNAEEAQRLGIVTQFTPAQMQASIEAAVAKGLLDNENAVWMSKKNMRAEELIQADFDKVQEEINELKSRVKEQQESIELMKAQEGLAAAQAFEAKTKGENQQWINQKCEENGYPPDGFLAHYYSLVMEGKFREAERFREGAKAVQFDMAQGAAMGDATVHDPQGYEVAKRINLETRRNQAQLNNLRSQVRSLSDAIMDANSHGRRDDARALMAIREDTRKLYAAILNSSTSQEICDAINEYNKKHGNVGPGWRLAQNIVSGVISAAATIAGAQIIRGKAVPKTKTVSHTTQKAHGSTTVSETETLW